MVEVMGCIIVVVMLGLAAWIFSSVLKFVIEVPKQLKRIADALEKRCKDGK